MIIKKNSWHYQLLALTNQNPKGSVCSYWTKVAWAPFYCLTLLFFLTAITTFVGISIFTSLLPFFTFLFWIISGLAPSGVIWLEATIVGCMIWILLTIGFATIHGKKWLNTYLKPCPPVNFE